MRHDATCKRPNLFVLACLLAAACDESDPAPQGDAQTVLNDAGSARDAAADASAPLDAQPREDASLDAALDASLDANNVGDGGRPAGDASFVADAAAIPACNVMAPTACATPAPRYADVAPIFEARCAICHGRMSDGPWPLDNYEDIAHWTDDVRATLVSCAMPPPDAGVPITDAERLRVLEWLRCGLPR